MSKNEEELQRIADEDRLRTKLWSRFEAEQRQGLSQVVTPEENEAITKRMFDELDSWDEPLQEGAREVAEALEAAQKRSRNRLRAIVEEGKAVAPTPEEAMREYTRKLWVNLVGKCTDTSNKHYRHWGGAGVKMCDAWVESFSQFIADAGLCPSPQFELQRLFIDQCTDFKPGNVVWKQRIIKRKQSEDDVHAGGRPRNAARVRVEYQGEMVTLSELADRTGIKKSTILARHAAGKSVEQMIVPVRLNSRGRAWTFDGWKDENGVSQVVTLRQLCKVNNVPYQTVRARLDKGIPLMMALEPKKPKMSIEERRYKQRAAYHAKKAKRGGNEDA